MNSSILWVIIIIGLLASVALLLFIIKKWRYIKTAEDAKLLHDKEQKEKRDELVESIKIIALCMIEEQVDFSEGCIRIKVLLDHVAPELNDHEEFTIFSKIYKATEHMPTHEARKRADKALIRKLDIERIELENTHKQEIIDASKAIRNHSF